MVDVICTSVYMFFFNHSTEELAIDGETKGNGRYHVLRLLVAVRVEAFVSSTSRTSLLSIC